MCAEAKDKKITRSYVRGLLDKLRDLGVEHMTWDGQELGLENGREISRSARALAGQHHV
jgi:hypothetical protein